MATLAGILAGIQTAGAALSGPLNFGLDVYRQRYQERMQQQAWMREDSAVQRRVADLKAAGLNPVLAAGSAASSSSPIQVTAPQYQQGDIMEPMTTLANLGRTKQDIATSAAEEARLKLQSEQLAMANQPMRDALEQVMVNLNGIQVPLAAARMLWAAEEIQDQHLANLAAAARVRSDAEAAAYNAAAAKVNASDVERDYSWRVANNLYGGKLPMEAAANAAYAVPLVKGALGGVKSWYDTKIGNVLKSGKLDQRR